MQVSDITQTLIERRSFIESGLLDRYADSPVILTNPSRRLRTANHNYAEFNVKKVTHDTPPQTRFSLKKSQLLLTPSMSRVDGLLC